jgi:penicillin amidase
LLADLDVELLRRVHLGERVVPDSVRWNAALPRAVASNNWVLSGRKTASGSPLLANDPHLEANRLPALWYEAVLEWGDRYCIAATMPGLPGALLGRTPDLAWGATYTFMDATDSWVEECRDSRYRRLTPDGETWVPIRTRTEVIQRQRHAAATVVFHETDHGVLDGDPAQPGLYLATRWASASDTGAASLGAILDMPNARTAADGMALMGRLETAWNWVFADRDGNIGYQMSGCMPQRGRGNGLVPLPGWDPANDWQGRVAPQELPRTMNPPSGFIVTANNDLNHLGRARPITVPMGSYRADRIAELLAARDGWTAADTQAMQMDVLSPHAQQFMSVLRPLLPPTPTANILRDWDCRYEPDSLGAPLFERFYRALVAEVFGAVCGAEMLRHLLDETGILADFYANFDAVLLCADSVWFGAAGRDAVYGRVAARVLTEPAGTWGERQQLVMKHVLLGGRLPRWVGFDHGPVPLRGGRGTIHQGQIYRAGGRQTSFAPSYRLVTDLAEAAAYTCLAGGPSDRRFSRWYATGIADWVAGRFKRLTPDTVG